jgi:hypothetical protein
MKKPIVTDRLEFSELELHKCLRKIMIADVHIKVVPAMVIAMLVISITMEILTAKRTRRGNKHEMPKWHIKMRKISCRKILACFP